MNSDGYIKRWAIGLLLAISPLCADEFPYKPPQTFTLRPDYIALHHPVSTRQIAAQLYFDQGLTLIYAFNHDAAYWSFLKASEIDPEMAMAYWGMALALGPNINMDPSPARAKMAYDIVTKGAKISSQATESERDYVQALARRYAEDPHADAKRLAADYAKAMKALSEKYPDDPDAAVLYAESLLDVRPWDQWGANGEPLEGTLAAVNALESVLKSNPRHLGANHYYIHAIEASPHPERALIQAQRLKSLMPASGHLLHMSSHIYLLVGDYHEAALSNEEAIAADRRYITDYGVQGIYPVHYLSHNLYFLSRACSMEGRFGDAKSAADQLQALYLPHAHRMPELEYYAPTPLFVLLRFHQWKAILAVPEPTSELQKFRLLWHFSRAMAYAALGDLTNAKKEQRQFLEEQAKQPEDAVFGYNKAEKVFKIAQYVLEGKLAEAQGRQSDALSWLRKAVEQQDSLHYNEPPDWFFPVREALGGLLLREGRNAEAEKVFREDLDLHPRNGRSLFGLAESLKAQSRQSDFYWVNQEFQTAWMYSDTSLTVADL